MASYSTPRWREPFMSCSRPYSVATWSMWWRCLPPHSSNCCIAFAWGWITWVSGCGGDCGGAAPTPRPFLALSDGEASHSAAVALEFVASFYVRNSRKDSAAANGLREQVGPFPWLCPIAPQPSICSLPLRLPLLRSDCCEPQGVPGNCHSFVQCTLLRPSLSLLVVLEISCDMFVPSLLLLHRLVWPIQIIVFGYVENQNAELWALASPQLSLLLAATLGYENVSRWRRRCCTGGGLDSLNPLSLSLFFCSFRLAVPQAFEEFSQRIVNAQPEEHREPVREVLSTLMNDITKYAANPFPGLIEAFIATSFDDFAPTPLPCCFSSSPPSSLFCCRYRSERWMPPIKIDFCGVCRM